MSRDPDLETVNRTLSSQVQKLMAELKDADAVIRCLRAENEKLRAAIECALRQLADGNRVLATGTLADALSGDKHD